MASPAHTSPVFRFGPFVLSVATGELHKAGTVLKLHPQPFCVLVLLVERAGTLVTREEIQHALWGGHTWVELDPVYPRGQAYLKLGYGSAAAAESQKVIDHPGIAQTWPPGPGALPHLGLARASALEGDTAKARAAYQDFLTLRKDADPDNPILKEAKADYAKQG